MIKYFNNNNRLVISHIEDIDGIGSCNNFKRSMAKL